VKVDLEDLYEISTETMCVCVFSCVRVRVFVCMYACVRVFVCVRAHVFVCMCACRVNRRLWGFVCFGVCLCVCLCACLPSAVAQREQQTTTERKERAETNRHTGQTDKRARTHGCGAHF